MAGNNRASKATLSMNPLVNTARIVNDLISSSLVE